MTPTLSLTPAIGLRWHYCATLDGYDATEWAIGVMKSAKPLTIDGLEYVIYEVSVGAGGGIAKLSRLFRVVMEPVTPK